MFVDKSQVFKHLFNNHLQSNNYFNLIFNTAHLFPLPLNTSDNSTYKLIEVRSIPKGFKNAI